MPRSWASDSHNRWTTFPGPRQVLLDATIVRMVLVPATMELLGDRNWWLPRWLDRVLPTLHVESNEDLDSELAVLTEHEKVQG